MRFWRAAAPAADVVIDLRERLAPYDRASDGDEANPEPAPGYAALHKKRDEPYHPRHMAPR